jgi:hypothetical protein
MQVTVTCMWTPSPLPLKGESHAYRYATATLPVSREGRSRIATTIGLWRGVHIENSIS